MGKRLKTGRGITTPIEPQLARATTQAARHRKAQIRNAAEDLYSAAKELRENCGDPTETPEWDKLFMALKKAGYEKPPSETALVKRPSWVSGEINPSNQVHVGAKGQRGITFKVVAVSSNRNSFGLKGVVLMARDGRAFQVGASAPHVPERGEVIVILFVDQKNDRGLNFVARCYEIPEELPIAPEAVVAEVWQSLTNVTRNDGRKQKGE